MSSVPSRSAWVTAPIFFGLFFGGGLLGMQVSRAVAPESAVAEFVSFVALPAAFLIGFVAWAGAALPGALRRLFRLARDRRSSPDRTWQAAIPPGSIAFVPVGLIANALCGLVVAVPATRLGFVGVLGLYATLGLGYGLTCWKLAQQAYLAFPRE